MWIKFKAESKYACEDAKAHPPPGLAADTKATAQVPKQSTRDRRRLLGRGWGGTRWVPWGLRHPGSILVEVPGRGRGPHARSVLYSRCHFKY